MNINKSNNVLVIDASRCKSGGAINHIVNLIKYLNYDDLKFSKIHIWSYNLLLQKLPNYPFLIKHNSFLLELPLPFQLFWQALILRYYLKKHQCSILFTLDSSTLCRFKKHLVLNQDLLSFEKYIYQKMPFSYEKIRIIVLRYVQKLAFQNATAVIFLSKYSKEKILEECDLKINSVVIAHGVDDDFKITNDCDWDFDLTKKIKCIYISPILEYKNQISVINSIFILRKKGYNISLNLVGGGNGYYYDLVLNYSKKLDKDNVWLNIDNFLSKNELVSRLKENHLFVFASSCETFGITLLEGMCSGIPIVCSNLSSLPEILLNGGLYFDPTSVSEISTKLEKLILDKELRIMLSKNSKNISNNYSWEKCSNETFNLLNSLI